MADRQRIENMIRMEAFLFGGVPQDHWIHQDIAQRRRNRERMRVRPDLEITDKANAFEFADTIIDLISAGF